ncbi:MAG: hypothetical protein KatS3mg077_0818 [Candidatus Binatia bacterium]|nr:MAG: hypothetical protein KatS3mg077_0818 [Candidatus Binatia bacterium]
MWTWVVGAALVAEVVVAEPAASGRSESRLGPAAAPASPQGWGRERLGMPLQELRQLYPDMQLATPLTAPFNDPRVQRYLRLGVREADLPAPVDVEYRMWDGKLWMVLVYTGANPAERVRRVLEQRFGPPTDASAVPAWVWPDRKLVTHLDQKWFALIHRPTDREARAGLQKRP